ncbi:MAG: hypothetical protein WC462_00995 [archaeon]
MAFQTLVEDSRRMNAKMIAMGQSIDIQKMPRPKAGTVSARKATYTPEGSDVEKMLYPKNFKARTYEEEPQKKLETVNPEMVKEIQEQVQEPAKIIGDDEVIVNPKQQENEETLEKPCLGPVWQRCRHYKAQGERAFCREYLGWCAKEKCSRPKL